MTTRASLLARAKSYPYERPAHPYLHLHAGEPIARITTVEIEQHGPSAYDLRVVHDGGAHILENRTAVIAAGSNAAPSQLSRKLASAPAPVAVLPGALAGHAIVYSAHFSRYGSIPATPRSAPGSTTRVHVVFLDPGQLAQIHATEALGRNYAFVRLTGTSIDLAPFGEIAEPYAYVSLRGCFAPKGSPIALSAIETTPRTFERLSQTEIQARAQRACAHRGDLDDFIFENARNAQKRAERIQLLQRSAMPTGIAVDAGS